MGKILSRPIIINKKTGQIGTYFKQKELPKDILKSIRNSESPSIKRILLEIRGLK